MNATRQHTPRVPRTTAHWLVALEQRTFLSAIPIGQGAPAIVISDADGDRVTVRLTGAGRGEVTLANDANDHADVASIVLTGTTKNSKLEVIVKKDAGAGVSSLASLIADSAVGGIKLVGVTLTGAAITVAGELRALRIVGDAIGNSDGLHAPGATVAASSLGTIDITGDASSLTLATPGDLRRLTILGDADTLRVAAGAHNTTLVPPVGAAGKITTIKIAGSLWGNSLLAASGDLGAVNVGGYIDQSLILAGAAVDFSMIHQPGITGQSGGVLENAVFSAGKISSFVAGADVIDSVIAAGGNPGDDGVFADHELIEGGQIASITIRGTLAGTAQSQHINPGIYAAKLGAVRVNQRAGSAVIDPLPSPSAMLRAEDIETILAHAIVRAEQLGVAATISVVDREGNLLAVIRMAGAETLVDVSAGGVAGIEALDGLVSTSIIAATKAGTAAFLSSSKGNAFTTRTAGQIIQTHFPTGVNNQASGPLFGVQLSNLPTSDIARLPLGLSADPGGVPLYRNGELIGGIGVEVDGVYTVDRSGVGGNATHEERIALAGQIGFAPNPNIRADKIFVAGVRLDYANAKTPTLASLGPVPAYASLLSAGSFEELVAPHAVLTSRFAISTLNGFAGFTLNTPGLSFVNSTTGQLEFDAGDASGGEFLTSDDVTNILTQAITLNSKLRAQIRRDSNQVSQVSVAVVDLNGRLLGEFSTLDAPMFGVDTAVQKARSAAFFSRPDAGALLSSLDAANAGSISTLIGLGLLTRADTFDSYVQAAQNIGALLDGSIAYSDRAIGFLARHNLPDGIRDGAPGPFHVINPGETPSVFNTGLQTDFILPRLADFILAFNADAATNGEAAALASFAAGTLGGAGAAPDGLPGASLDNGLQIFAGSVPLYKNGVLVGAIGVSGDGIDQDDYVAIAGARGFQQFPASVKRADQIHVADGVRLPYVKLPRSPFDAA